MPENGIDPAWFGEAQGVLSPAQDLVINTDEGTIVTAADKQPISDVVYRQIAPINCGDGWMVGIGVFSFLRIDIPDGIRVRVTGSRAWRLSPRVRSRSRADRRTRQPGRVQRSPLCRPRRLCWQLRPPGHAAREGPGGGGPGYGAGGPNNEGGGGGGGGCGHGGPGWRYRRWRADRHGRKRLPDLLAGPAMRRQRRRLRRPRLQTGDTGQRGGGGGGAVQIVSQSRVVVSSSTTAPSGIQVGGGGGQGIAA